MQYSILVFNAIWYISYIVTVGLIGSGNRSTASHWQTYQIMLYRLHFAMSGFATCRWPTIDIRCTYNVFVSMILMKIQDMGVFFSIHVWPTKYLSHRWPRMCSVCCNNNPVLWVLSLFMTYNRVCSMSNTTGVSSGAGTAYLTFHSISSFLSSAL